VNAGALLVTAIVTARNLGPSGRGSLVLYVTVASFAMIACSLGLNIAERVHLVSPERPIPLGDFVTLGLGSVVLQGVVTSTLCALLLPLAHVHPSAWALAVVGGYGSSALLGLLTRDTLYGFGHNGTAAAVDALGSVMQLSAVVILAYTGALSIPRVIIGFTVANLIQVLATVTILVRMKADLRPRRSLANWRRILRTGLASIGIGLTQAGTFRFDRLLTGLYLNTGAVGIYSVAATTTESLWVAPVGLSQVLFHRIASHSSTTQEITRVRRTCLGGTVVLAIVGFFIAPEAVRVTLGHSYVGAVTPLRLLLPGAVAIAMYHIDAFRVAGSGRTGIVSIATVAGFVMVTLLDLALIPSMGINGAALASTIGYILMAAITWRLAVSISP
jgi:O-antigen/teichoic acid export membrane protein